MQTMSIKQDELANTGHTHKELTKAFALERKKIRNNTYKPTKSKGISLESEFLIALAIASIVVFGATFMYNSVIHKKNQLKFESNISQNLY